MLWYKFWIGDYITHTTHLADAEDLAYRRLLDLYYLSERPIPLDTHAVARKIRLDLDITETVLDEFFDKCDEGYRHSRCDDEIGRYLHQVENNRQLGKRGGRPKKTESEPKVNPIQKQKQKEKNKNISSVSPTSSRFDEFWTAWPNSKRKVAKSACKAKWDRLVLDPLADKIIAVVTRLRATEQWLTGYDPAPLTFINQKRWEDDAETDSVGRRVI
jgi:uncharacterized protein YdaU (DUF1376 family)